MLPPGHTDPEAELYARTWPAVVDAVCRRLGNREEAEAVAQEALLRALDVARREPIQRFGAYAMRIALNLATDRLRQSDWRARSEIDPAGMGASADDPEAVDLHRLRTAVDALPAEQRQIVELRYAEEQSFAEIARTLNMSKNGVFERHARALDALRAFFGRRSP